MEKPPRREAKKGRDRFRHEGGELHARQDKDVLGVYSGVKRKQADCRATMRRSMQRAWCERLRMLKVMNGIVKDAFGTAARPWA